MGPAPAPCSFTADTLVTTTEGEQAISQIELGDLALAFHEATGTTGYYTVTAVMRHLDPILVKLQLAGESIVTTPEHPFYVVESAPWLTHEATQGHWVPAGELAIGDAIRQADGTTGTVHAVEVVEQPQVMYNLTVAEAHTFFVGDGQWLVHNQCNYPLRGSEAQEAASQLGYTQRIGPQKVHFNSHGQPAFYNRKERTYITPDVDGHNGGVWKMFDRRGNRLGTYDGTLNRIGD